MNLELYQTCLYYLTTVINYLGYPFLWDAHFYSSRVNISNGFQINLNQGRNMKIYCEIIGFYDLLRVNVTKYRLNFEGVLL